MIEKLELEDLGEKCIELRDRLQKRDNNINDIFNEIKDFCANSLCAALNSKSDRGVSTFLEKYIRQVGSLLYIIRACRQSNLIKFLSALDEQCKYFFARGLYNFARMIPVHLAMTGEIKRTDPETWEVLFNETFDVNKSNVPFTTLFNDQNLEQKIKEIKGVGGVT